MNKKGFTLIELLAVIIILGILMIIAIPSVTKYINDSRKSSYIDTAKELVSGARNLVNEGKLEMYATDTTYYIPSNCIKVENGDEAESPYGKFLAAYIGVIYNGQGYKYYWISVDDSGQGIKNITPLDKLETDLIESDLKKSDVEDVVTTTGIGKRSEIKILNCSDNSWDHQIHLTNTNNNASEENGGGGPHNSKIVCKRAETLHEDGYGNTFGRKGSGDSLNTGEAFDCDVNADGTYDAATERFYYMYTSDGIANLIFFANVYNGEINHSTKVAYYGAAYDSSKGPVDAAVHLPTTSQWSNVSLSNPHRQIKTFSGSTYVSMNSSPFTRYDLPIFDYSPYAARLLSMDDIDNACGPRTNLNDSIYFNASNNCLYFTENIVYNGYMDNGNYTYGYFLESTEYYQGGVKTVYGYSKYTGSCASNTGHLYGVRPVIEVPVTSIEK